MVLSLARALHEMGNYSVVGLLEHGWLDRKLKQAGLETVILQQHTRYDLLCLRTLCNIVRRYNIDLIHSHEFMMNVYGTAAAVLSRIPVITTVHGKNYYWEKPRRRVAYRLTSHLSRMVTVCDDLKRFLGQHLGISDRRITTIYNGIDLNQYSRSPSPVSVSAVKQALLIPPHSPIIGTVGMLVPAKDHSTLLKAARHVIQHKPDAIFLLVGDGQLGAPLKAEAHRLGIVNNLRFAGFTDHVTELLHITDVYVCSSRSEGLSLSILEAMAAGKPIVATNVGGNAELIVDEVTGFLVPSNEPERMAEKLILLLRDRTLARQLGASGQQRVYEKFSLERMVHSYRRLYEAAHT